MNKNNDKTKIVLNRKIVPRYVFRFSAFISLSTAPLIIAIVYFSDTDSITEYLGLPFYVLFLFCILVLILSFSMEKRLIFNLSNSQIILIEGDTFFKSYSIKLDDIFGFYISRDMVIMLLNKTIIWKNKYKIYYEVSSKDINKLTKIHELLKKTFPEKTHDTKKELMNAYFSNEDRCGNPGQYGKSKRH